MYAIKSEKYSKAPLIPNDCLKSAMNAAINYNTGFNKSNISCIDKTSYAKGVYTVIDALSETYENDKDLANEGQKLISQIFSIPGNKETLESFLKRLSSDLGCEEFYCNQKTIINDIKNISKHLKEKYCDNERFDFNSFMVGVKCIIGPIKKTYDKFTGDGLKSSDNIFSKMAGFVVGSISQLGMNVLRIDEKSKPMVEKLSYEINDLYYSCQI